ncbi:hypothetical protein QQF64_020386 [Cirrhinus molitorella]|uniref:Uncharacterized protein n=1 Tax=Cirrhinus molitorella TaxID=172907 RepID=A0ABR3L907_9TELE
MASPHSDIPQCINSNEPERISQSEQQLPSPHCHIQMSSPLTIIQYPSEIKTESAKKNYKQKLLSNNPETLFADLFKTGEICNLIFFSDHPSAWHKAIIKHYPSVKKGICNGWKVKIREPQDPDDTMITVNIYKNGTVMVQGNLKIFQADYRAIAEAMKHEKALLSESLSSEQNPQNSSSDLRSTHTETAKTENIPSSLLKSIPILMEHFMKLEMEMLQLRETMLKQQQSHTCAAHTELQQNTEHQTQRLTALTQQMRTLQTEKDSYQCELTSLRLQLQDREQSTLEMRQQLREIQEEREQQNSEIQALKEQMRELLLAREETAQTHRAQTLPSTPKPSNTVSQHPPLGADSERLDPDSSQPSQSPLSGSPVQQHQPSSHSSPAQTSTEKPEVALLIDSNGKFIDIKKLFPRHRAVKFWCPTTDKALEPLTKSQLGQPSHIIIHTGTNDLWSQQDRVFDFLRAVVEKARETFPNSKTPCPLYSRGKTFSAQSFTSQGPHRAPASRADLYGQRLSYNSPNAPAAEARPQQSPVQTDRPSYTQAVSGGVSRANTELHEIQHMLSIICSQLLTHSGQW